MTEEQWLKAMEPQTMLSYLRHGGKASERQLRLWACACVRRVWPLLTEKRSRQAVEVAELFADGLVARNDFRSWGWLRTQRGGVVALFKAEDAAESSAAFADGLAGQAAVSDGQTAAVWEATFRAAWAAGASPSEAIAAADAAVPGPWVATRESARKKEQKAQAALLRDIIGNPFQPPPAIAAAWLAWSDGAVVKLAQSTYDDRLLPSGHLGPPRLAELAAALEAVGSGDAELLGHLRGPGPHVRGCWGVEWVLGKA